MKRTVIITGATRGLGLTLAVEFAKQDYQVALNYAHNEENAKSALAEVKQCAPEANAQLFKADVLTQAGVEGLIKDVTGSLGSPDTIVINATPPQYEKAIEDYTQEDFDSMASAFMMSPHYLTNTAMPAMKENQFGRIIHITSEVFSLGNPLFSAYVSAKGAQVGYMRSSAMELAPHGITVNAVSPGWIPVERHDEVPQESKDGYLATIPAGRWGTREDIANAVLFFAQESSGFVTAQTLQVNGGKVIN